MVPQPDRDLTPEHDPSFTILDWIGVAVSAAAVAWIARWPFGPGPSLQKMLKDFGGAVPRPTELSFSRTLVLTMAVVPAILVAAGALGRATLRMRRLLVVAGFVVALGGVVFLLYAYVLPIYAFATMIK